MQYPHTTELGNALRQSTAAKVVYLNGYSARSILTKVVYKKGAITEERPNDSFVFKIPKESKIP